jgi:hypothetical protein
MTEAQAEIAEAQAEHHHSPDAAAQKAVAAQMKAEEWCTRFPGEIAKFRGQLGMQPVPINGSPKQGLQAGYFQMPLRDGTTGYFQRGTDDCLQASIASCVQVKPHLVPVLHIDQQMMLDKDPEEIELGNNVKMGRWMDQHGVTICRHTALPSAAKRWIGVVPSNGITQHCLLMTGRDVLFDCASWTQPGKDEPVSSYSYDDVNYAITIDRQ